MSLPKRSSCFLFGPRQTGKSTLVESLLSERDFYVSLLPQRDFIAYAREPGRFRAEVLAHVASRPKGTCFVDEVQRLPELLNEVHDLIERHRLRFVLTGSSARKLRHGGANLLAGRAVSLHLAPLTAGEIGRVFDLERCLRVGTLPRVWDEDDFGSDEEEEVYDFLRSYVDTYLREEVQQEGLVRNVGPFARFLEIAAASDGEVVNHSAFARECGVSVKTVQAYYSILEDTFLAHRIDPFVRSARKRLVAHPKYYFFDPGVTNALAHVSLERLGPVERGRRFEQWCALQTITAIRYRKLPLSVRFWRTNTGVEVDLLIVQGETPVAAVEIKSGVRLKPADMRGLASLADDHPKLPRFILGPEDRARTLEGGIEYRSWEEWIDGVLPGLPK